MSSIRMSRFARALSYILLAAMVLPLSPWVVSPAHAQGRIRSVLLFTVADESASGLPEAEMRKIATDSLQMAIDALPALECTEFARTSPLVRRAASEGRILPTQLETGPTSPRDAVTIGHALSVDTVVLSSIQSYRSTQVPRSVEVILSGQAYDVKPNYDVEAGEPVAKPTVAQAFGVVGVSRKVPGYTGSDRPLAREAIDDAAYRVAKVLTGASIIEATKAKPAAKKSGRTGKLLAYALALGAAVWLISASCGSSEGGINPAALPPTPLPLQLEGTDTIRISWQAPTGTSFQLLRYQIQRSVNQGAWTFFGNAGASANVPSDLSQYPDYTVSSGNSYRYRIRALYTNSTYSQWVPFDGITI